MRRSMLVDSLTALCMLQRLDPAASKGLAEEEALLATAFELVRDSVLRSHSLSCATLPLAAWAVSCVCASRRAMHLSVV